MIRSESNLTGLLSAILSAMGAGSRKARWIVKIAKKVNTTTRHHLMKRRFSETEKRCIFVTGPLHF